MYRYILKRLLMLIPVLLGTVLIVFFIMDLAPADPAKIILGESATEESVKQLREEMGLDDPFVVRYISYVGGLLKGDFGTSYKNNQPVAGQIMKRLPNTVLLAFSGALFAVVFGVVVGIVSAKKQYSVFDNVFMVITLVGAAAPAFWCGLILVLVFSLKLGWFPSSGMGTGLGGVLKSLILPAITIGLHGAATTARTTRSTMLEIVRQDYIDTARAKGLKESVITRKHMLKNAWIPIITVVGLNFGVLLGGSVLTETVFSWPGVGRFVVESIKMQDIPAVLGCVVTLAILFTFVNLLVDILYAFVDPRIKAQYKGKAGAKR